VHRPSIKGTKLLFIVIKAIIIIERKRHKFDPEIFYEYRFWNRRPDGIVSTKNHRTLHILEFKRSSDRNEDFLVVKEEEANKQHRSIIEALRAAAPEWTFEQINFVAGRRGAVVDDDFYKKLRRLIYLKYPPKWRKCESFRVNRSVVGDQRGPWTGWIDPAPV